MAGGLVFGKGRATISVSPGLQQHVEMMLRTAAPRTMEKLRQVTGELVDSAAKDWPVKTGKSKAGLNSVVRLVGNGVVEGVVSNREKYAFMITLPGGAAWAKRLHVWSELVRKPGAKRAPELAEALKLDLIEAAAKGR